MNRPQVQSLDAQLDALRLTPADAQALFDVADALDGHYRLRSALSDPTVPGEVRARVAKKLFGARLAAAPVAAIELFTRHLSDPDKLIGAVERAGLRVLLASSPVEQVQDELFRIARIIEANPELQTALADPGIDTTARQELIGGLLAGRACPVTLMLVRRALGEHGRTLVRRLDAQVELAAEIRNHAVARVTVAMPLTAGQLARLRAELVRIYGVGIDVEVEIAPEVLGGVRIQVGDELIDGTLIGRLEHARSLIG